MKIANCINIRYEKGDYYLSQRESGRQAGKVSYKNGYKKTNRGTGWASNVKPSRLVLTIEIEGDYFEVWVDRYFKDSVGKLTEKRVIAITNAMPSVVNVHECTTYSGDIYYVADDACLDAWKNRAGL